MTGHAQACLFCGSRLAAASPALPFTPGTAFEASGNYGSGVFDPHGPTGHRQVRLRVVLCDACLVKLAHLGRVTLVETTTTATTRTSTWDPDVRIDDAPGA